ncbi:hypothetical protein B0H11DRAFT_2224514 [Mycena galericulata]|nr:hypothetical protein B0H11DRAFT_2224514 [Mycena galericulata]
MPTMRLLSARMTGGSLLSQFNLYVNTHAELLRANFVAHDGMAELKIVNVGTRFPCISDQWRLEKLREYGLETIAWYHLLHPVLVRFVAAFDSPESAENADFWGRVAMTEFITE